MVSLPFLPVNVVKHQFPLSFHLETMPYFVIKVKISVDFFRKTPYNCLFFVKNNSKLQKCLKIIFYLRKFAK